MMKASIKCEGKKDARNQRSGLPLMVLSMKLHISDVDIVAIWIQKGHTILV